jgi:hypothetical protein
MIAGINEILSENAALITLIGENKIFPMVVPLDTEAPYLCSSLARSQSQNTKDATGAIDFPIVNINVHTDNYDDLEIISQAIRTALVNNSWVTDAGYNFDKIWFFDAFDRPDLYKNDNPTLTRSVQFQVIKR